ncbi:hypothetical protein O181_001182 [Austropuccinia psidii MF-1]|uniref:Uncharacterized protein n=1 Tax=Austropuccinia psidii MF-1 TaxID=1389203 RepID=A0A9Q3BA37_9BASI|nr:hypothetical protein [Austropuccinia psidii MF-1]
MIFHYSKSRQKASQPSYSQHSKKILAAISTILPPSPNPSTSRPSISSPMRPSPIAHPRPSPVLSSQKLKPVSRTNRRREVRLPLRFPDAQVFQIRECWPVRVSREDPNVGNEGQDDVARSFWRVYSNSGEEIMYGNDIMMPGTASEEMAAKFIWYEDELINDFQRSFDALGRDK